MDILDKIVSFLTVEDFKSNPIISPSQIRKRKHNRKRRSIKSGYYKCKNGTNIFIDSGWELAWVLFYEDHNLSFERNINKFPYTYKGYTKHYIPDFYLPDKDMYIEIKGKEPKICQYKYTAIPVHKLTILRVKEMQPYIKYAIKTYGEKYWSVLRDERY